jgi:anhydro-N-acetylmuramic acid kinase
MQQSQKQAYDKDGNFARSGEVIMPLLQTMLKDSYFAKVPPKSTGREYFNMQWLEQKLAGFSGLKDADIQRTLLELTAVTIANEVNRLPVSELILCGGGAKNGFLVERIKKLTKAKLSHTQAYGIESDSLEAMLFAWLAKKRIHREKVALKSITGAKKDSILGAIYG